MKLRWEGVGRGATRIVYRDRRGPMAVPIFARYNFQKFLQKARSLVMQSESCYNMKFFVIEI